ncbi:MAG: hypothetical protein NWF08_09325 [Candidatus Bathyarchaeota archaeon]|nr:hypothetical protein [Candidatus Bathyarchaeota archaeon]
MGVIALLPLIVWIYSTYYQFRVFVVGDRLISHVAIYFIVLGLASIFIYYIGKEEGEEEVEEVLASGGAKVIFLLTLISAIVVLLFPYISGVFLFSSAVLWMFLWPPFRGLTLRTSLISIPIWTYIPFTFILVIKYASGLRRKIRYSVLLAIICAFLLFMGLFFTLLVSSRPL